MPFASLEGLRQEMIRLGVVRLLFKVLSTNDNSKQQIYLGSGYDSLKMIPGGELHAEPGLSRKPVSYTHLDVYKRQGKWIQ